MVKEKDFLMKVARYEGPLKFKIRNLNRPSIRPDQVLVMVHAASVCGTDLRIFRGETDVVSGIVLGHDFSGTVVEIGRKVKGIRKGDKIAISPVGHCGRCEFCLSKLDTMCIHGCWHGFEKDGGFAQFVAIDEKNALKLPNKVSLDQAAILEPFVVAMRCFERAHIHRGDWICIFGQGAIGLAITCTARSLGYHIVAIEPNAMRRVISRRLGASACFRKLSSSVLKEINDITKHKGIVLAIEASGTQSAVDWGRDVIKSNGILAFTGSGNKLRGPLINTGGKELSYLEIELGPLYLYKKTINLIAKGRINPLILKPLRISLDQLPQVIKQLSKHKLTEVKVLVYPNKSDLSK